MSILLNLCFETYRLSSPLSIYNLPVIPQVTSILNFNFISVAIDNY